MKFSNGTRFLTRLGPLNFEKSRHSKHELRVTHFQVRKLTFTGRHGRLEKRALFQFYAPTLSGSATALGDDLLQYELMTQRSWRISWRTLITTLVLS